MSEAALSSVSADDISAAHERIRPHVRRTPVFDVQLPGKGGTELRVSVKLELLQHAGSFKPRGAFNTLLSGDGSRGPITAASGGNHGIAVAYAAARLGLHATIFVPTIASPVKVARIRSFGAEVVVGGDRYDDARLACGEHAQRTGALEVHAFDAAPTIAGQGTVAKEWLEDAPDLDTVLVAVGGGGLIAGMAAWLGKRVRVVGVEPEGSRCLQAALAAGHPVDVPVHSVAADSLGAKRAGEHVLAIARELVDRVVLVSDDAIRDAQVRLWTDLRIAAEPGGAAAHAALVGGAYQPAPEERVGVLVCGGNVDLGELAALVR